MAKSPAPLLTAKSVAIVGATERSHWPTNIFSNLKQSGYPGPVWPVNPKREEVWGETCWPDISALPDVPELLLLIIPAAAVPGVLEQGIGLGVKSAIVYANGIGEGLDPEVIARGAALKSLIGDAGIAVCGPNCMGLACVREKLYLYPHTHISEMEPGPVGLVFQSGGTLSYLVRTGRDRGLRFSYCISSGNELDLDMSDYMNFLVDDPHTEIIQLFIEGIRKPDAFMAAAARALAAGKPIVAIKTGRSEGSREAARSHSGAIAGDFEAFDAMCERYGIVNCPSLDDMIETTLAFQCGRLPRGQRMAFMTASGGTVDLLYDYVAAEGASMPDLEPASVAAIRKLVNPDVTVKNPIDIGSPIGATNISAPAEITRIMAADPNIDMVGWALNLPGTDRGARNPEIVQQVLAATDKPVVGFARMNHMVNQAGLDYQDTTGMPFLQGLAPTVRAMNALWFYGARKGRAVAELPPAAGTQADTAGEALQAALAACGITPPAGAFADSARDAVRAAEAIGFPVALKIVSADISHKTEAGGVRLGLRDGAEVTAAADQMAASVAAAGAALDGFLVQEMVDGIEMIVGARIDALYGPMMVVGAGGVLVELVKDASFRLLPLTRDDAGAMLDELKAVRLLHGYRGSPAADLDALVAAICTLSDFFLDHRTWLADLEINPLVVLEKGNGVRAVDIRPVRRGN